MSIMGDDTFRVAIDDTREYPYADVLIRCGNVAVGIMQNFKDSGTKVDILYLDHDLGDHSANGKAILYNLLENDLCPPKVSLITGNPVGKKNMEGILGDFGYVQSKGSWIKG